MTIAELKVKVMAELDEIDSANLTANIGDYINKMYPIIDTVQKELAFLTCPVKAVASVTASGGELTLPSDLYELRKITDSTTGEALHVDYKSNRVLQGVPDGTYKVEYNAVPVTIDANTEDSYALQIDEEGCEALVFGVCALICINDEPDLYAIYVNKYNEYRQNIVDRRQTHGFVTITGGIDL